MHVYPAPIKPPMIWAWLIAHPISRVGALRMTRPTRNKTSGRAIGRSPPIGTAGNNHDRSIGERVDRKYCQSRPDTTRTRVRRIADRCQISIRPVKHSITLRGSVEKNSFIQMVLLVLRLSDSLPLYLPT